MKELLYKKVDLLIQILEALPDSSEKRDLLHPLGGRGVEKIQFDWVVLKKDINIIKDLRMKKENENLLEKIENVIEMAENFPDPYSPGMLLSQRLKTLLAFSNDLDDPWDNSLLLFTIGPVQGFISNSRKTQDFYVGSFLLSYLTSVAISKFIDICGPFNVIYPDIFGQPFFTQKINSLSSTKKRDILLPTIPNRFVGVINTSSPDEVKKIAKVVEETVRLEMKSILEFVLTQVKEVSENISQETLEAAKKQLSEFPEIYWVAIPFKVDNGRISSDILRKYYSDITEEQWITFNKAGNVDSEEFYRIVYSTLEKLLGARKNLREFNQLSIEEDGRKCSVCGENDVVFYKDTKKSKKFIHNKYAISLNYIEPKILADGEGLCTQCFIKRMLPKYLSKSYSNVFQNLSFPSSAEIAASKIKLNEKYFEYAKKLHCFFSSYKDNLPKVNPLELVLKKYENLDFETIELLSIDGTWLYKENLTVERVIKEFEDKNALDIEPLSNFLEELRKFDIKRPTPYYAIIYLDGDSMGEWLSGRKIKGNYTPSYHGVISTALKNYSLKFVRRIVEEEHLGKLVYAGGDDVLAFVNVKDLFSIARKLRWAFSGRIVQKNDRLEVEHSNNSGYIHFDNKFYLTMGPSATASMGVVIAHYKAPLQRVVKKVFEMEKKAKNFDFLGIRKNSIGISLMKRSGETREAVISWGYYRDEDNFIDIIELLEKISQFFDEDRKPGHVSKRFVSKIYQELWQLFIDGNILPYEITKVMLNRLIKRTYVCKIKNCSKDMGDFESLIDELLQISVYNQSSDKEKDKNMLSNFVNLIYLASKIMKDEE